MIQCWRFPGLIFAFAGFVILQSAPATASCAFIGGTATNMSLVLNSRVLSVGASASDGTVVLAQRLASSQAASFHCTAAFQYKYSYATAGLGISAWSGAPFAGATYYQTGVPGIAAIVSGDGTAGPLPTQSGSNIAGTYPVRVSDLTISLVKVGPVTPGTVSGTNLPQVRIAVDDGSGPLQLAILDFTGGATISAPTCLTRDVAVTLGQHGMSEFTGVGSTTSWVDFSIPLFGCPPMSGNVTASTPFVMTSTICPAGAACARLNKIDYRLDPNTAVVDASQGKMGLAQEGGMSATGIAVQVGQNLTPIVLQTVQDSGVNPGSTGGSYSIDLQARYIQIAPTVTPGPANASAMFTITYQ